MSEDNQTNGFGNPLWRLIAVGAVSAILGFIANQVFRPTPKIPDNIVTVETLQSLMPEMIAKYSPYTEDQKDINSKLESINEQLVRIDTQVEQQALDISSIAARTGTPARPLGAGKP